LFRLGYQRSFLGLEDYRRAGVEASLAARGDPHVIVGGVLATYQVMAGHERKLRDRDVADRRRFEAIFEEHFDAVLGYAVARADLETAADAVAETFLVAWRRRGELPAQPRGWLLAVTRRTLADQRRARRRQASLTAKLAVEPLASAASDDPAEAVAERRTVLSALARLRPADQELLRLVAWDGLSPAEVGVVVGRSRATVAVRLHRARRRLVRELAAAGAEPVPAPTTLAAPCHPKPLEEA
jgi:RNA polymerase sigma factor (sigma-70 family)